MTNEQIIAITDNAKQPCLVGFRGFDEDIQQFTCRMLNGKYCDCYNKYKQELIKHQELMEHEDAAQATP